MLSQLLTSPDVDQANDVTAKTYLSIWIIPACLFRLAWNGIPQYVITTRCQYFIIGVYLQISISGCDGVMTALVAHA